MKNKTAHKNIIGAVLIVSLIIIIGVIVKGGSDKLRPTAKAKIGTNVNDLAPAFAIQTIAGQTLTLDDFKGKKALVITSTASWCPTCILEAKQMSPVYPLFNDKVEFLSVSIDPSDDRLKLEGFKANNNTPWFYTEPNLPGTTQMIIDYKFSRFEITYIIDKHGIIKFKDSGITSTKTLNAELSKL